jgi:membrane associated rhomboid family serine protease
VFPLGEERRAPIFPFVTYLLILANVVAFYYEVTASSPDRFVSAFALIPYDVANYVQLAPPSPPSPYLTLLTSQFMHASLLHLVSNMLFLFVFGPEIEYICGHVRYLAFYLICGVLGGVAQISIGPGSHVPSIGASGAIAGVLGAYLINFPTNRINTLIPIGFIPLIFKVPAVIIIGIWAATQFVHGFGTVTSHALSEQGGGIAYFTHIGGFLAGVILIGLFRRREVAGRNVRYNP